MNARPNVELLPDSEKLARFTSAIFKHADPKGFVSLRGFFEAKENARPLFIEGIHLGDPQFHVVVSERARQAAQWQEPIVFCPPVATFKTSQDAKADNVLEGVALSVDCDQSPTASYRTLAKLLGGPTIVVRTGGEWTNPETGEVERKGHLHWRLKKPAGTPEEQKLLREARRLAAELVGSDPTAASLAHPLRWPGSWHRKKDPPRLADIVSESDNEIDLYEALRFLREASGASCVQSDKFSRENELEAENLEDVAAALRVIPNENLDWATWNYVGLATWGATAGSEQGAKAFAEWSAKAPKNDPEATAARWKHYATSPPDRIGFGTLVHLARRHSPSWAPISNPPVNGPSQPPAEPVDLWGHFDPPAMPRGLLPDLIESFAFDKGRSMGADMAGLAVSALAVCAAAIPDKVKLQVKRHDPSWLEEARFWGALVGPPSTKKSPIMRAAMKPLKRLNDDLARRYSQEKAKYDALSKDDRAQTQPPRRTQLILNDATVEAAQEVMKDSPDGVICMQDELAGWFGSMDRYTTSGRSGDRGFWLQTWNGGSYSIQRVARGFVQIDNLSMSLLGGIQPEPIRKIVADSVDDGLVQRILPVILKPAIKGRDEPESAVGFDYVQLIGRLRQLDTTVLRFDDGAQAYREELEERHLALQDCEAVDAKLSAHIGKYDGIFARLCVIWHCIENTALGEVPTIISEDTARRAGEFLHKFFLPHAIAFHIGMLGLSNDHDRLAAIAGYILAKGLKKITNRDMKSSVRLLRKASPQEIEEAMHHLDNLGWVDPVQGPRPSSPVQWAVNPAVHTKFAARAKEEEARRANVRKIMLSLTQGREEIC